MNKVVLFDETKRSIREVIDSVRDIDPDAFVITVMKDGQTNCFFATGSRIELMGMLAYAQQRVYEGE